MSDYLDIPVAEQPESTVPANDREVATIGALANPKEDARPFEQRVSELSANIRSQGTQPTLATSIIRQHQDTADAYRRLAENYAAAGDAERTAYFGRLAESEKEKSVSPEFTKGAGHAAAVEQAVDNKLLSYVDEWERIRSDPLYNSRKQAVADLTAARNVIGEAVGAAVKDARWWDYLTGVGAELMAPFQWWKRADEVSALTRSIGREPTLADFDKASLVRNFAATFSAMDEDSRKRALTAMRKEISNPVSFAKLASEVLNYDATDLRLEQAFDIFSIGDLQAFAAGMKAVVGKGRLANAFAFTGSGKAAGKVLGEDLVTGAKASGLANDALIAKAMASGNSPLEVGDKALEGLSVGMQETIVSTLRTLYSNLQERLAAGGLTKEETAAELARIRNSYSPEVNKAVAKVIFGEADSAGSKAIVWWQDEKTGRAFSSKEAAEAFMHERGIVGEAVTKNSDDALDALREQKAFHGGYDWDVAKREFVGTGEGWNSMGWGLYSTKARKFAESYAERYGGTKPTVHELDIPEYNMMMNWDMEVSKQSNAAKAFAQLLPAEDIVTLNKEGAHASAFYQKLVENLGGDQEKASKALDAAGIHGAYTDRAGKSSREFVVYDLNKVKQVDRTPLADKQVQRLQAIRDKAKLSDEEAAIEQAYFDELVHQSPTYRADPNTMRKAQNVLGAPEQASARSTNFTGMRELFRSSSTEISGTLPSEVGGWVDKMKDVLGMNHHKILVITDDSFDLARVEGYYPHLKRTMDYVADVMSNGRTGAVHISVAHDTSIIITHAFRKNNEWITTLAHEFGHAFDFHILQQRYAAVGGTMRQELIRDFSNWVKTRDSGASFVAGYRAWGNEMDVRRLADMLDDLLLTKDPKVAANMAGNGQWYAMFDEWFAEQFARWVKTADIPKTVLEQFFAGIVARMEKFADFVSRLITGQPGAKVTREPAKAVREFLDEHVRRVAEGEFVARSTPWAPVREIMGRTSGTMWSPSIHIPGKPNVKLKAPKEEWYVKETRFDPLSYGAVGKYTDKDIASMPWIAVDPKHGASELAVEARVVGVHAEAKVRADLMGFVKPFYDKLNGAQKARVKAVLEAGDAASNVAGSVGKEYTYMELAAKGLSEDEAAAYFATRQLRQTMYHLRDGEMVRHARAQGLKDIEVAGQRVLGTTYETATSALSKHVNTGVFDTTTNALVFVRQKDMEDAYTAGKVMVKLDYPITIGGKQYTQLFVSPETAKIREVRSILNYRPGEFSRIYTDEYFIRMTRSVEVDGEMKEISAAIRTAPSAREAGEFTKAVTEAIRVLKNGGNAASIERLVGRYFNVDEFVSKYREGEFDGFKSIDFHYTRNRDEYLNGSLSEAQFEGRTFTSKRGDKLMSTDATKANTLDVYESLQAEITNISRVVNINEWRETSIRRWMNSFGDLLPTRTGNDVADFYAAAGATLTKGGGKDALFAERTHKYIMRQIGVRTKEEQWYEAITRRFTEAFFTGNTKVETVGAAVRQARVLDWFRSVNFNFNLGMFNPAQLIVQANGAATAVILSPIHGLGAAKTMPLLRVALTSDNPEVWKKLATVDKLSNIGLSSVEEFVELVKAVRRTGILDNTRSTALHNLEDGKLDLFASYPKKVVGEHAFFFNRGEEASRLISFDTARREWQASNPGKAFNTREALADILVRMDDLTQNMTKANLARWQEGALSIPLQFAQYNLKLAANVVSAFLSTGRGYTKGEAVALLTGHLLFYGAAGNGISWLVDEMLPEEMKDKMSTATKTYLAQGLFAGLVYQAFDANVALGSRLGAFDYYQRIAEAAFKDPTNVYQALLGPSLSTAKRLGVIGDVAYLWWKDPDLTGKDVAYGLGKLTSEQIATLRNATKAYLFYQHQGKFVDGKGVPLGNLTGGEIMAQALGFSPTLAVDVHNLIKSKKDHNEAIKQIAETIFATQVSIMQALNRGDEEYAKEQRSLLLALWPDNAGDAMEVQRMIKDRLYPYSTEMQKLLGDYVMKGMRYDKPLTPTTEPKNDK